MTCICGVVLRDHNDVIEFNSCNDLLKLDYSNPTPLRVRIRSKKCLSPGISIKNIIPGANAQYEVSRPLLERHKLSPNSAAIPSATAICACVVLLHELLCQFTLY